MLMVSSSVVGWRSPYSRPAPPPNDSDRRPRSEPRV